MDEPLEADNWPIMAPSPLPYHPYGQVPREMNRADMDRVRDQFVRATEGAEAAGLTCLNYTSPTAICSPASSPR
jgi:anthraniloyl-CoA monooxygenase